jgi:hypothetical protein
MMVSGFGRKISFVRRGTQVHRWYRYLPVPLRIPGIAPGEIETGILRFNSRVL